jgi:hypothetical protein
VGKRTISFASQYRNIAFTRDDKNRSSNNCLINRRISTYRENQCISTEKRNAFNMKAIVNKINHYMNYMRV